jgi:hypothetical protein
MTKRPINSTHPAAIRDGGLVAFGCSGTPTMGRQRSPRTLDPGSRARRRAVPSQPAE